MLKSRIVKKVAAVICLCFLLTAAACFTANAEDGDMIYDTSGLFDSLSDEVRQSLENMGVSTDDFSSLSTLSFEKVMGEIFSLASDTSSTPLKGLLNIIAMLLICSVVSAYGGALSFEISNALNIVCTMCITGAAVLPAVSVISNAEEVVQTSSGIMLAYIPVMVGIMASTGKAVSASSYYVLMVGAGQGVAQLSSNVIVPLLNMFLGLSVTSSVSPSVNLKGFISCISKTVKWLLGFAMTVFTAVLTFRQLVAASVDNVSTRAVRFALNSFIPIVGSALSDAYKVVQGSVGLLKSGVGVVVILCVAVVFLPAVVQCALWMFALWLGKSTAGALGLSVPEKLLDCVAGVFSILSAVLLCIMSIYILSTAAVLLMGGGSS